MNKADMRIMASPKRAERVKLLVEKRGLSDSAVTWDDRPKGGGAMYTARIKVLCRDVTNKVR